MLLDRDSEVLMGARTVTRETTIEQLLDLKEDAVSCLFRRGIRCIRCGEPIWDTVEEAAMKANYAEAEIDQLVLELNGLK